jgi:hypothetical protein
MELVFRELREYKFQNHPCVYFVYCVSFGRCVILYDVCYFCMICVICVLCLIVVPLPPGENPFAVKYKYNIYI